MTLRLRLALDENFPTPLVTSLREYIREVELVPVREIDARLPGLEDWQLLLALHKRRPAWAGMVTADARMLNLPREVCVLKQTGLALVVAESAGMDPLVATGVLLAALPRVAQRLREKPGGIFRLRPPHVARESPDDLLGSIAKHRSTNGRALYRMHKLTKARLRARPARPAVIPGSGTEASVAPKRVNSHSRRGGSRPESRGALRARRSR